MKFERCVLGLLIARAAAVAVLEKHSKRVSEAEALQSLLENPQFLPDSSYGQLKKRTLDHARRLGKRDPQIMSTASLVAGLGVAGAAWDSLFAVDQKAPNPTVSQTADFESELFPGALRRKVRYGPYRLPATSEDNIESEYLYIPGIANTFKWNAQKPCDGECVVLALEMSMEHADGAPAENANGAWFHHAVLLNAGPSANNAMCGGVPIEVLAMVGNEKGAVPFAVPNSDAIPTGYHVTSGDTFIINTQLQNMEDKEKYVWLTVTYDYVDGRQPDYLRSRMFWQFLTTNQVIACGNSVGSVNNPFGATNLTNDLQPKKPVFSEHTLPIEAGMDGYILASAGHMHDGGVGIDIFRNNELICSSEATYSAGGGHGHGHGSHRKRQIQGAKPVNGTTEHISSQSRCTWPEGLPVSKKDKMHIQANYDFNAHPGIINDKGELDSVMGIVGCVIAQKK